MKRTFHTKPDEILAQNSDAHLVALRENGSRQDLTIKAIEKLEQSVQDKSVALNGHLATINAIKESDQQAYLVAKGVATKLEEIKSATLATNITLKKIEKYISREPQKFPEIPKVDNSNIERLLGELLAELRKPKEKEEINLAVKLV